MKTADELAIKIKRIGKSLAVKFGYLDAKNVVCQEVAGMLRSQAARITELEAQLADAQKDAARYQWLRSRVAGGDYRVMGIIYSEGGECVDAGIDTAMQLKDQP